MSDNFMRAAYLVLLLIAVGGFLIVEMRDRPGKTMRQAAAWLLIFLGTIAVAGLWPDIRNAIAPQQVMEGGRIEVPLGPDGHYRLTAELNGESVRFVVDTGASDIALTREDARRIGINPDNLAYTQTAMTANGPVGSAPVRINSFRLGDFHDENVPASVNEGEMFGSLLGMSYLSRFARISIEGGRLVLER